MAASDDHFSPNLLLQSMTSLWFHQNILIMPARVTTPGPTSETPPPSRPPSSAQVSRQASDETTTAPSSAPPKKEEKPTDAAGQFVIKHGQLRLKPATSAGLNRSNSLSPVDRGRLRRRGRENCSCKSLSELEDKELKGFMDLGFTFKEKEVSSHVMQILPGLQKLGVEERKLVSRPYLSEAWLIGRPDSPLLNLRIPQVSASSMDDMKRHLRCWARTVADEVQQES